MMKNTLLALVLISVLFFWGCQPHSHKTIIHNVNGYTLNESGELIQFTALVFQDGKVLTTGREELLEEFPRGVHIDYEGKTMIPGIIDAHAHVMGLGESLLRVNLMGIETLDETLEEIKRFADENESLAWITGRGWNQVLWPENEFPTAADIDRVVSDRPVYLRRVDGHAAWVNSLALEKAGIDHTTEDPQGGAIIKDEDGNPSGILIDRAMYLVDALIPEPDDNERRLALDLALESIAAHGITSIHDAGVSTDAFRIFRDYANRNWLTTRIYGMIGGSDETFDELAKDGPFFSDDDMLTLRSVKLYSDGALGSRGAALKEEYSDDPGNYGLLFDTEESFYQQITKVADAGFQVGIHAIGDKANHVILNAFERRKADVGDEGLRHRIEHSQIVSVDEIPRFAELGIIASMQPVHASSDLNMAEDRVGPNRIMGGYAWRTFLDAGVVIASGSDFPVEFVNPFYGFHAGINRTDLSGNPEGGWYPELAMSRTETFRSFTLDAAYAAHQDDVLGTLEPGKWADFVIIDRDFFTIPNEEIININVLETWVAGQRVFLQRD